MQTIKLQFTDFWRQYDPRHNLFIKLIRQKYNIEYSESPDVLFYSCYGKDYLKYDCTKVFFTAENLRPDFTACDYAISFDYLTDKRHFRWPLSAFYIDYWKLGDKLSHTPSPDEARKIWRSKQKFCSMVVSNANSKRRIEFFKKLSMVRQVDSGGQVMNNVGGPVADKQQFIKDYKFVFAFENSSYPGYTTEKIVEPLAVGSIPLYWGNPLIRLDFNKERFLDAGDYTDEQGFIERILEIERDEDLAIHILTRPVFANNIPPDYLRPDELKNFLYGIIDDLGRNKPVSQTFKKSIHLVKRKVNVLKHYSGKFWGKNVGQ